MKNSERIQKIKYKVLKGIKPENEDEQLDKWLDFLEEELIFPFEAKIQESENFELQWKDIVKVKKIDNFIEPYGILFEIRKGRRKYIFPACGLKIIEKKSNNRFVMDAFLEWWSQHFW